jgi:hypothetical protein
MHSIRVGGIRSRAADELASIRNGYHDQHGDGDAAGAAVDCVHEIGDDRRRRPDLAPGQRSHD